MTLPMAQSVVHDTSFAVKSNKHILNPYTLSFSKNQLSVTNHSDKSK